MSGSQLLVNGQFAGMLQRVQPDSGTGYVVRADVIERVIGGFFTGPRNEDPDFSPPPLAVPSNEINLWLRRYESVMVGDQHTSFGIKEYSGLGYSLQIQMNTDWHYMSPGQRMPFPDSRGECHIIYMRTDDPTPTPDRHGDERHGFAVVCNRKQEQPNAQGTLRRRNREMSSEAPGTLQ
jgi:hypothetical protein